MNPLQRGNVLIRWIDYLETTAPRLVWKDTGLLKKLKSRCVLGITPEEAFAIQFLLPELGTVGYARMSMSRIHLSESHLPHYEFRNEWWVLKGLVTNQGYYTLTIWRHTFVPSVVWDTTQSDNYSQVKIITSWVPLDSNLAQYENKETSDTIIINSNNPFRVDGILESLNLHGSVFPMSVNINGNRKRIDSKQHPFMMSSNGCTHCYDGVGIKKYIYPKVIGDEFSGYWEHGWEAGILVKGYSSSMHLRSLNIMNTAGQYQTPSAADDRLELNWTNSYETVFLCISPVPIIQNKKYPVTIAKKVKPDGFVEKLTNIFIEITKYREENIDSLQIHHDDQVIELHVLSQNPLQHTLTNGSIQFINTPVEQKHTHGHGFLFIASRISLQQQKQTVQSFLNLEGHTSSTVDNTDLLTAWLLWVLPLFVIIFLIIAICYMVSIKRKYKFQGRFTQKKKLNFINKQKHGFVFR